MLPHVTVSDISALDFHHLRDAGFVGVVFDKDNTITAPYADDVDESLRPALDSALKAFGPQGIAVLSNSAGGPDDTNYAAAEALQNTLSLPVLRRKFKKPRGFEAVREHFNGCEPSALIMVGDRLLTDITFGNLHGMLTVHTTRLLSNAGEPPVVRVARRFESVVAARYVRKGVSPPPHPLLSFANLSM